ncbi:hypothetical protein LXA43DRAFT_1097914 [Ganoderma leucocontextum]|nr:hypothetical protein LXA43DRAFT_1097914 [Ganoderma leucocontextum]
MLSSRLESLVNSVSNHMAKSTARPKPGKTGANDGDGPKNGGGDPQSLKDSEPKSVTAGPHPPSPPESPKQQKHPLSGPRGGSARPSNLNTDDVAVSDLLGTMQNTLTSLGKTYHVLGEQTIRVASLAPAVDALSQIESVQRELDEKKQRQDDSMQQVKDEAPGDREGTSSREPPSPRQPNRNELRGESDRGSRASRGKYLYPPLFASGVCVLTRRV